MSALTKFTADARATLVAAIRLGVSRNAAARAAKIDPATVWRWEQRGKDDLANGIDSEWAQLANDLADAESEVAAQVEVSIIEATKQGQWKAGAWWLSKRKPELYSREASAEIARQVAGALLERIRQRCRPETYQDVISNALDDVIEMKP